MVKVEKALGFVHMSTKIMDINEDDTDSHICSISATFPPNVKAIILRAVRISGSGDISFYPNSNAYSFASPSGDILPLNGAEIKYIQSNGGDDFDIYCYGYFTEGEIKQ